MSEKEKSIKILRIITRLNVGGPAQHAVFLTESLNNGAFQSKLVFGVVDDNEGDMSYLARERRVIFEEIACLKNRAGVLGNVKAFLQLYRIIQREKPAIIHLHLLKARFLGGLAAKAAGATLVLETFHGDLLAGYYGYLKTQAILMIERLLGHLVMDRVLAVSKRVQDNILRFNLTPARKVVIVPIGLELKQFIDCAVHGGELRRELGIPKDVRLVGIVGRMVPIKGHRYFLEAAREVLQIYPSARFVLVGDGVLRSSLELQCRELGIEESVIFLGWRKDLSRIYADFDLLVLSSLNEGTPVSLIEGMAAGKAVVATEVGGVPDVVKEGVTGILVPPKNSSALAKAVLRLLADHSLRALLGQQARASVYPKYDVSRLVQDMQDLYLDLVASQQVLPRERPLIRVSK